jgi:ribonuclease D
MSLRVRTFEIRNGTTAREDEEAVSAFLRAVEAERIETAYAAEGWRLLIVYHDTKDKEESAQIASVVAGALRAWRAAEAIRRGVAPLVVLGDDDLDTVAHYVPTTALELRTVMGTGDDGTAPYEEEIVQVVRQTLDELV